MFFYYVDRFQFDQMGYKWIMIHCGLSGKYCVAAQLKCFRVVGKMPGVVGSRRDLIFVISELYYEVGDRHFVVGGKIAGCMEI